MTQPRRLPSLGRIDRSQLLHFTFNGKHYTGFSGDTLASALLANGVRVVARSFKYHRPRGILSAGVEEPNALIQLGTGEYSLPNYLATQVELYDGLEASSVNCWPSVNWDVRSVTGMFSRFLPPGFYYKTFMWPRWMWPMYERQLRKAGGFGVVPTGPDPDRYDKTNAHCDVLVVGGGPAGIAAALEAGRAGARVILADEQQEIGGSLLSSIQTIDGISTEQWLDAALCELNEMDEVRILPRSTVFGYYDHNFIGILERVADHLGQVSGYSPRQRIWRIRSTQVVLATGSIERPIVFRNNDRPGVMLASAISTYVNRYGVRPGDRCVLFTNNDSAYQSALDLVDSGGEVPAIVDFRPQIVGELPEQAKSKGIEVFPGSVIVDVKGGKGVNSVEIMPYENDAVVGNPQSIKCDLVGMSGGWNPVLNLHSQSGGHPVFDNDSCCFVPGVSVQSERSAGACNAIFNLNDCFSDGQLAGAEAAEMAGFGTGQPSRSIPNTITIPEAPTKQCWVVPGKKSLERDRKCFVDFQTEVTIPDLAIAAREGYEFIEHVKRYTTLGMGTDQGKLGAVNGVGILAKILKKPIPEIGLTTFRQPYSPVTFGAIAGRDLGELFDPVRKTSMHEWHVTAGAQFENVGQWKRPWYYPASGESMHDAVNREVLAVRNSVGVVDASTLGKIDIKGPDAAEFLNRVYINGWSKLDVGKCRYGFMLNEEGMIFDDGVTARIAKEHFLMHTTTSGAANVMSWLEFWLQTEWPDLRVFLTSVTDHWATVAINGPKARKVISKICRDVEFENTEFPFMSVRQGTILGQSARIFRISFAGELSYEINVNARYGPKVWESVMDAGAEFGITPYGTETMHVLRAEKGYLIVGQDTDGSVTPMDLGMGRMVSNRKDFLGKRSLKLEHLISDQRKQFVGLLPEDENTVLPEGGQIVKDQYFAIPAQMIGHVTSSYYSATLGRSIALGVVKGGRSIEGETVYVPMQDGSVIGARVTSPVFYDPGGKRQDVE